MDLLEQKIPMALLRVTERLLALPRIVGEARGPPRSEDPNGAPPGVGEAAVPRGVVRHKLLHS